ncbi:MAG: serine/threonine protein kinase [Acidobacteria bacterium]|nr:serine/threonine protein kinase [Acidobacteriota bacterium]
MELVEGEDLSEKIGALETQGALRNTGMPLAEALSIARQIIDALEAAHDIGIVHRDLKPANIKVRHDGTVKVLNFELAKAMDTGMSGPQDAANSPTLTARVTQMGMILGTAAYMSLEQARGRAVDKRTDVWAFGCVLYEILSGKKAFDGEDATEIISAVVKSEPNLNALPATLPANVRTVIERCLVKDRKARIPDLSVVRFILDGTIPTASSTSSAPAHLPRVEAG